MDHYDAIVIGIGVMGAATTYHLAKRGHRVLALEQFAIGHDQGSSHGHSRIIRLAYDFPDYIQLAQAAYPLWRTLEQESGIALLRMTGGLDIATSRTPSFAATRTSLAAVGIPFEDLTQTDIVKRFPQFHLPDDTIGIYQPDAGILNASLCVSTLVTQARRYGARLQEHEPARQLLPSGAGVMVHTDTASYTADRLIVTVGSWAQPLLHNIGLDVPLTISKELVAFFQPSKPDIFEPERFPIFIHHYANRKSIYGFPIFGLPGIKIAQHGGGPSITPDDHDQAIPPDRLDMLSAYVTQHFPHATGTIIFTQTCRYTMTPDEHFIIDHLPDTPQIIIGSPCSGHGFKFGALIGAILADLTEHGTTTYPIERFTLARFTQVN